MMTEAEHCYGTCYLLKLFPVSTSIIEVTVKTKLAVKTNLVQAIRLLVVFLVQIRCSYSV